MHWHELLWHLEHRLGMYVGLPRYERACAVFVGFDLARDRGELAAFREWLAVRRPGSPLTFSALVLQETVGEGASEVDLTSDDDHRRAVSALCRLFREFLRQRASTVEQG